MYLISPILRSPHSSAGAFLNTNSQVGEPFIPNLFSSLRTITRLSFLSYISNDKPRASEVPSSVRANTKLTSASPFVINRFTPFKNHCFLSASYVAFN